MARAYLVVQRDYFYNDEFYYDLDGSQPKTSCARPHGLFWDEAEAQIHARALSRQLLAGSYVSRWGWMFYDLTDLEPEVFCKRITDLLGLEKAAGRLASGEITPDELLFDDLHIPEDLPAETMDAVLALFKLRFYEVVASTTDDSAALERAQPLFEGEVYTGDWLEGWAYRASYEELTAALELFDLSFQPYSEIPW